MPVRRYPGGKRFAFGHHGTTSHQANTAATPRDITVNMKYKRDRHKARETTEITRLLAVSPGNAMANAMTQAIMRSA
jgi:hypothetical protein